jgi:DNA-binding winged helix-turn-helix (wHTH) protein
MHVAFGEYQLDTETRALQSQGRRIPVQSKAFDLLAYLIARRERVVPSAELLDALWPGLHVTPAAPSTASWKARQAVGDDGESQAVLKTEHCKGFWLVAEVTDLSPPETARSGSTGAAQMPPIAKLKRRNVFRVTAAYGIVAWLLVKVASSRPGRREKIKRLTLERRKRESASADFLIRFPALRVLPLECHTRLWGMEGCHAHVRSVGIRGLRRDALIRTLSATEGFAALLASRLNHGG